MYTVEIRFNNGNVKTLEVNRAKLADIDDYFNAECGAEVNVVSADNEPELTVDTVNRLLVRNHFKETRIVCPDGTRATVSPCAYGYEAKSASDCEYFLIYWDLPWGGESTLEKLVETLNRHAELKAEQEDDKAKLRAYFDEHQRSGWNDDSFSFYSDWHKDVYGYRPHGLVCGEYVRPY